MRHRPVIYRYAAMNQTEFKKIVGVLLLGSTMLAEMYFQNRELEILRSMSGHIAEEAIDILSENMEYREIDLFETSKDEDDQQKNKEHLADRRVCNLEGETTMHLSAAKGQVQVVKYLLETGQDADIRTREAQYNSTNLYRDTRQTPLHYAAAAGYVEVMQVLIDYGADVSAKTECGDTALHKAALHGKTSAVRWLLDHGGDPEAKNVFGATPLSMALVNNRKEAAVVLLAQRKSEDMLPLGVPWTDVVQSCQILLLMEAFMLVLFRVLNS